VLDSTGQKMSKHKGNIVDPFEIMDKYGADVVRWYLVNASPPWRPKMFKEEDLLEARNKFFDTLINTYRFFALYSNLLGFDSADLKARKVPYKDRPEIDRWIISALNTLKKNYFELMDTYEITKATRLISDFTIDDLSNWYVRRNRKRFRNPAGEQDKLSAYGTLQEVLVELVKMTAPFSPFLTEELYRNLTGDESVHLSHFDDVNELVIDGDLEYEMHTAQQIVYLVRTMRVKYNLKTRQPLKQILVPVMNEEDRTKIGRMKKIILEEVNVKELNFVDENNAVIKKKAKPNFKTLGPKFGKEMKQAAEVIKNFDKKIIAELEKSGTVKINLSGTEHELTREDIEIQTENIEGWIVESSGSLTAALDTKLDAQLINEGLAREFVNKVQNLRKDRMLGVNDRIKIKYYCDEELESAIASQKKYIEEEIMAVELMVESPEKLNGFEELNINGRACKIFLEKIN
jgi:isoleucyl-tRNA synthetase